MRLDHVSYAAGHHDVVDVVQRLGGAVGAAFFDGGRHPRFGTRNFVLPLENQCYLEVVAPLDHPSTDTRPFGQAVLQRVRDGGGWLGWAVAVEDITAVEQRLGRPSVPGNRHRPDGVELRWRQVGVKALIHDPQLPFFVQWLTDPRLHPSSGARPGLRIAKLELAGNQAAVDAWLGGRNFSLGADIEWVEADEPGLLAVHIATPHGTVRLD